MSHSLQFEALEPRVAMSAAAIHAALVVPAHGLALAQVDAARGPSPRVAMVQPHTPTGLAHPAVIDAKAPKVII
jgi:hypothetical protein